MQNRYELGPIVEIRPYYESEAVTVESRTDLEGVEQAEDLDGQQKSQMVHHHIGYKVRRQVFVKDDDGTAVDLQKPAEVRESTVRLDGIILKKNSKTGKDELWVDPDNIPAFLNNKFIGLPTQISPRSLRQLKVRDTPFDWQFLFSDEALDDAKQLVYSHYLPEEIKASIGNVRALRDGVKALPLDQLQANMFLFEKTLSPSQKRDGLATGIIERFNMNPDYAMSPRKLFEQYKNISREQQEFFAAYAHVFLDRSTHLNLAKEIVRHNVKQSDRLPEMVLAVESGVKSRDALVDSRQVKKLSQELLKQSEEKRRKQDIAYRDVTDSLNALDKIDRKLEQFSIDKVEQSGLPHFLRYLGGDGGLRVAKWLRQQNDALNSLSDDLDLMPRSNEDSRILRDTGRFINTLDTLSKIRKIRDAFEERQRVDQTTELTDAEYKSLGRLYYDIKGIQRAVHAMASDKQPKELKSFVEMMDKSINALGHQCEQFDSDVVDIRDLVVARIDEVMQLEEEKGIFKDKAHAVQNMQMLEWVAAFGVLGVAASNPEALLIRKEDEASTALDAMNKVAVISDEYFAVANAESNYPFRALVYNTLMKAEKDQRRVLVNISRVEAKDIPGVECDADGHPKSRTSRELIARREREAEYRGSIAPSYISRLRNRLVAVAPLLEVKSTAQIEKETLSRYAQESGKALARAG